MYTVYILLSLNKAKTYTGVTSDLLRRLEEHNQGKVTFSKKYRPYKVLHSESFETAKDAYAKEKYYKTTSGRRKIKIIFNEQSLNN